MTDRELDALVAKHIMKLDPKQFKREQSYYEIMEAGVALEYYSTNIAAAWKILEDCVYPKLHFDHLSATWVCEVSDTAYFDMDGKINKKTFTGISENAAKAICLAALKAKGIAIND